MSRLCDEEGRVIQDEDLILERVHRLIALPSSEELNEAVKELPVNKAPEEDGLIAEVLHELWEEVGPGCLRFVQEETGCQVLNAGQFIMYLGCRFGIEGTEEERSRDLQDKIQRKLSKWVNRFLTWASRVILLQHILRAIPVYKFLGLGLRTTSYNKLETPCKAFLWGMNSDNKAKTALVSWNTVTKRKENGGLHLRPFKRVSEVLKMRYLGHLMHGEQTDWAQMVRYFIRQQLQKRTYNREIRLWTAEEGLLLLPLITTPQSEMTNNFIKSWLHFRKFLHLDEKDLALPGNLTLKQLKALTDRYLSRRPFNDRVISLSSKNWVSKYSPNSLMAQASG
ncbi:hypothetical protein R1flu_018410 [Riccia fluitans]|uniref:Uncharacterized protein n=1 Tax=Riccia fluitans TaxID=41844 RepID=A0ABD1ZFR5_9MARC